VHAVATHPTKPLFASVGDDSKLHFWDLAGTLYVLICPYMSLYVLICPHVTFECPCRVICNLGVRLYVLICPYMSLYVLICPYMSLCHVRVSMSRDMQSRCTPICPYMSLYVLMCPYMSLYVLICPYVTFECPCRVICNLGVRLNPKPQTLNPIL